MRNFYLLDGTGLVYRAFFAIRELNTSEGEPVNALYGLSRMLSTILKNQIEENDGIVFFLDRARKTFRSELYPDYKAHRPPMPDELRFQMGFVEELVHSFGIKVLSMENYEADDLIATFVRRFKNDFDQFNVITSDKDLLQLVGDKVNVLRAEKGVSNLKCYDEKVFGEKYGFKPIQMIDYLSLMGDKADNIPGIKGIGDKRAKELIAEFGTLEKIYQNLDKVSNANKKRLEESRGDGFLSKKLVILKDDIPLQDEFDQPDFYHYSGIHQYDLMKLLGKFQFDSLIREWSDSERTQGLIFEKNESVKPQKGHYQMVNDDSFESFLQLLKKQERFAFDTETTSLNVREAKLVGISISWKEGEAYYLPLLHKEADNLSENNLNLFFSSTKDALYIGHNLKYDFSVLRQNGYTLPENYFDTMIASFLLNPDQGKHGLDFLAKEEFDHDMIKYDQVIESVPVSPIMIRAADFSDVSVQNATDYSGEDADYTFKLYNRFAPLLENEGLHDLFFNMEMPFLKVLIEMETNGVYFDREYLKNLSVKTSKIINEIVEQIYDISGTEFNLNSPVQIGEIFFGKLGLPSQGKTAKSKKYKTGKEVLEKLAEDYDIARLLLEYRKYSKLKSTYIDAIPNFISEITGRVHSSFHQTGTATGRLSSSDPNLQNLPKKEAEGREIRKAIKPQKESWRLISADYSQVELRLMAHIADDQNLILAFKEDMDIHAYTASKIFGIAIEKVSKTQRNVGKTINFSIIYGISAYGLSSRLKISVLEAKQFIEDYFEAYPNVKKFMNDTVEIAEESMEVRTEFGRLRKIKYINSKNKKLQEEAKRIAINSPIQGTAADIMKLAMINILKRLSEEQLKSKMIIQIHDEVVIESPEDEIERVKEIVKFEMENVCTLKVPLKVDIEILKEF
ncbi:MAG TPA: DNA polymerase I [Thermotogota bacterium]|nr:DNA polymerase I [Thermotogota bacterium]